jgi:hypothetical protein
MKTETCSYLSGHILVFKDSVAGSVLPLVASAADQDNSRTAAQFAHAVDRLK